MHVNDIERKINNRHTDSISRSINMRERKCTPFMTIKIARKIFPSIHCSLCAWRKERELHFYWLLTHSPQYFMTFEGVATTSLSRYTKPGMSGVIRSRALKCKEDDGEELSVDRFPCQNVNCDDKKLIYFHPRKERKKSRSNFNNTEHGGIQILPRKTNTAWRRIVAG